MQEKVRRTNLVLTESQYQYLRKWAFDKETTVSSLMRYLIHRAQNQMLHMVKFPTPTPDELGGKDER